MWVDSPFLATIRKPLFALFFLIIQWLLRIELKYRIGTSKCYNHDILTLHQPIRLQHFEQRNENDIFCTIMWPANQSHAPNVKWTIARVLLTQKLQLMNIFKSVYISPTTTNANYIIITNMNVFKMRKRISEIWKITCINLCFPIIYEQPLNQKAIRLSSIYL